MKWYIAHIIMYVRFDDGHQDTFPIWENLFLVSGDSEDEALLKAERYGREDESNSAFDFLWNGCSASLIFAGIRKLIECTNSQNQPNDGTELSYSQLEVKDQVSLLKLVAGEAVTVTYEE